MKKMLILLCMLTSTMTVRSADIDVYGKVNLGVWYFSPDRFYDDTIYTIDTTNKDTTFTMGLKDTMDLVISNWLPFGTFGAEYKGDRFGGRIEMGIHQNIYDSKSWGIQDKVPPFTQKKVADYITLKRMYAEWYINDLFTLLFGKSLVPTNFFPSNQMFFGGYGFNNIGCLCTGTHPMLQLSVESPNETFEGKIAVIKPDTSVINIQNNSSSKDNYQCDARMPKFEGGLKYSIEKGIFSTYGSFAGGFQKYDVLLFDSKALKIKKYLDLEISSYVIGTDLGVKVGPVSLSVDALYGKNIGIYGAFVGDAFGWWRHETFKYMNVFFPSHGPGDSTSESGWELFNGTAFMIAGILNIKPTEFLSFEGGIGMAGGDHEFERASQDFHNTLAWYFQTELTVLEMLKFTPEVGRYDYGPLLGFGRYIYWGMNTGIEF